MGWVVHGSTRVCAERAEGLVRLDDHGTSSRGASSKVTLVDWVLDGLAFVAIETERAHAHFVHVGGPCDDCTGLTQATHCGRVDGGDEIYSGEMLWFRIGRTIGFYL